MRMITNLVLVVFCLGFLVADGDGSQRISKDILVKGIWSQDVDIWADLWGDEYRGLAMEFGMGGKFRLWNNWMEYYTATGDFIVKDDVVITNSDDYTGLDKDYPKSEISWIMHDACINGYDLIYSRRLESESGVRLFDKSSLIQPGTRLSFGDRDLILTEKKLHRVIDNLNVRESPTLNSQKYTFQLHLTGNTTDPTESVTFLPQGRKVVPIARTLEKERIADMNNYWFYVTIDIKIGEEYGPRFGWVYGAFIEPSK